MDAGLIVGALMTMGKNPSTELSAAPSADRALFAGSALGRLVNPRVVMTMNWRGLKAYCLS